MEILHWWYSKPAVENKIFFAFLKYSALSGQQQYLSQTNWHAYFKTSDIFFIFHSDLYSCQPLSSQLIINCMLTLSPWFLIMQSEARGQIFARESKCSTPFCTGSSNHNCRQKEQNWGFFCHQLHTYKTKMTISCRISPLHRSGWQESSFDKTFRRKLFQVVRYQMERRGRYGTYKHHQMRAMTCFF